jgi:diguanylate cyclase (GGDEF)-like protein
MVSATPFDNEYFIDQALKRLTAAPGLLGRAESLFFFADIERAYQQDIRSVRIRELRVTIGLAILLDMSTSLTDFALVPDLSQWPIALRIISLAPMVLLIWTMDKVSNSVREVLLMFASIVAITALLYIAYGSSAAYSPLAFTNASFALLYMNCVFPARFSDAVIVNMWFGAVVTCITIVSQQIQPPTAFAVTLQSLIAVIFGLVGNYRLERGARTNYLLFSKEALSQAALSAERDKLETLSNTDGLTGLSNRAHFERYFERLVRDGPANDVGICLLMIDVDHFKKYNDTYGHPEGDHCLKLVSSAITAKLSGLKDLAARYGGEEFILLLHDVTPAQAISIAERIRLAVEAVAVSERGVDAVRRPMTVSIGLTVGNLRTTRNIGRLVEIADRALYQSKRGGRNRCTQL